MKAVIIWSGALLCLFPFVSSATALVAGLILSLLFGVIANSPQKKTAKLAMQFSIVFMGFGMDPSAVVRAGTHGVFLTAGSILFTLVLGALLAKWFEVPKKLGTLLSMGTAICGASAIAAVTPIIKAEHEEVAVGLAVVFLLNSTALLFFPELGHILHMSPESFGTFAGIAIHDTSSVVGAASRYGDASLSVATTVKLTRALWILPITLVLGFVSAKEGQGPFSVKKAVKAGLPWFIPAFLLAVAVRATWTQGAPTFSVLSRIGKAGLNAGIFLIGAQMSREALKKAGSRPLIMGVLLWAFVIVITLVFVQNQLV